MSRLESTLAARDAEIAALKGDLSRLRADAGHLRARLAIMSEREWAGGRRGISALAAQGRPVTDDYDGRHSLYGGTGFCEGAWY